jgi:Asp-tRNA(Asn)/Glu-tRNA(Gln) amidotransferase A subunit family amidase
VAVEAHRHLGPLVEGNRHLCSAELLGLLDEGGSRTQSDYDSALARRLTMIDAFDDWIQQFDAVIAMATLGEAPSLATTGDPRFCTPWTLVGAPAITVPTGLGPTKLPLGIQLVGGRHRDRDLIAVAMWLEKVRPGPGRPQLPGDLSEGRRAV